MSSDITHTVSINVIKKKKNEKEKEKGQSWKCWLEFNEKPKCNQRDFGMRLFDILWQNSPVPSSLACQSTSWYLWGSFSAFVLRFLSFPQRCVRARHLIVSVC